MLNLWREGATQPQVTFKQWGQAGPRVFFMTIRYMGRDRIEDKLPHIETPVLVVRGSGIRLFPSAGQKRLYPSYRTVGSP
jgi:hypothetical protein